MSVVRVLGVNGSPRKYGNTFKLLTVALRAAAMEGAETKLIHLYDYRIEPCIGCLCDVQESCRYPCVIEDDMRLLYDEVLKADALIIATPIYWYQPSGVVKNFLDRLTALENMIFVDGHSWVEGKVAGVIAAGNDSGLVMAASCLLSTLISMGFMVPPFSMVGFNTEGDALDDPAVVSDAANLGRNVALLAKLVKGFKGVWYDARLKEWGLREAASVREEAARLREKEIAERMKRIGRLLEGSEPRASP